MSSLIAKFDMQSGLCRRKAETKGKQSEKKDMFGLGLHHHVTEVSAYGAITVPAPKIRHGKSTQQTTFTCNIFSTANFDYDCYLRQCHPKFLL